MIRLKQLLEQALKDKNPGHTVIFMAGMDPGNLSVIDQTSMLTQHLSNIEISVHEYDDLNGVLSGITKNPTAFVVLFAEACINADEVVEKLQNARTLFVISPTNDPPTTQSVRSAVSKGLPEHHIIPWFGEHGIHGKPEDDTDLNDFKNLLAKVGDNIRWMIDHDPAISVQTPIKNTQPENTAVPKINVNDFKRQWRALGHTIKISSKYPPPDELTNGGTVDEEMLGIVLELITEYGKLYPGLPKAEISAGNDWYHQHELSYVSVHTLGLAIDLVPHSKRRVLQLEELIKQYKKKYTNFDWINEFTNPSSAATGPHYHLYLKGPVTKTPKY